MTSATKARRVASTGLALALAFGAAGFLPGTASADEPTVTFYDTFESPTLDTSKWLYTLGTAYEGGPGQFGTGEIETNTAKPENVSVHDGSLYITPTLTNGAWESARIESVRSDFKPAEGSVMTTEFRAALPDVTEANGSGYWPALWMNGSPYRQDRWSWPAGGEFDIGESVSGGQWSNSVLHCGYKAQWGGPCNEPSGINAGSVPLPGAWGSFNDYSFQWDRSLGAGHDQFRWYHNGTLTQTVNQGDLPADVWASLAEHEGSYIIMNVAIDGAYPAAKGKLTNAATKPGVPMRVASVRVSYTAGGSVTPPVTTPPVVAPPVVTPPPVVEPPVVTPPVDLPVVVTPSVTDPGPPPPVQTGLQAVATAAQVTLTWDAVPGATGYEVLRAGIVIPELSPTTELTAVNTGLNPATPYIYSVRPVGGQATPEITVTTLAA
jgi:hypothetical protein